METWENQYLWNSFWHLNPYTEKMTLQNKHSESELFSLPWDLTRILQSPEAIYTREVWYNSTVCFLDTFSYLYKR